jgi:hypothetical protein
MLRKLGGKLDRNFVEDESVGDDVVEKRMVLDFDGCFEAVHDLVPGNFDRESVRIVISQDPAINAEEIRVSHGWNFSLSPTPYGARDYGARD